MATFFCEASSRLRASSHISSGLSRSSARLAPSQVSSSQSLPGTCRSLSTTPALHARLIRRPQRPYQFTQIVQLSDGSTYMHRTTSPHPVHRATKDSRNHIIWQPSDKSLRNLEVDEAGRLAAFRNRFGHGWDAAENAEEEEVVEAGKGKKGKATQAAGAKKAEQEGSAPADGDAFDSLADLLSGYAAKVEQPSKSGGLNAKDQAKLDRKKKK
ncbi:50s ribosomal protein [Ophiostoma piceae UAMH 11346]|uniref:50s ribosomal protein n=1 Tax=Ophiostoma piceae (strain UAMH 11346) TaxID=1262450 RepID=S3D3C0_OPHP1|nr:50s ribosomal protein [Ophiostoma piceae UAMH 11346]